jgi:hypothetical protein
VKKDIKAWAIKLRGRSFYKDIYSIPFIYPTRIEAMLEVERIANLKNRNPNNINVSAELVCVKVRIEEIK